MKPLLTIALITIVSFACKSTKNNNSSDNASLKGTWQLNYITGPRIAFDGLYPDKKPFIKFNLDSMQVSGNNSCNGFGGKFTLDGNKLKFGNLIQTMMACPGEGEPVFRKYIEQVDAYKIENGSLILMSKDVMVMRFNKITDKME